MNLQNHRNEFTNDEIETFGQMIMAIMPLFNDNKSINISSSQLLDLCCAVSCNSISINDGELQDKPLGVSFLNFWLRFEITEISGARRVRRSR